MSKQGIKQPTNAQIMAATTQLAAEVANLAHAFNVFATDVQRQLDEHSAQFVQIHVTLNEHTRILNEHTTTLNDHTETLEHLVTDVSALKVEQASNIAWFKRQDARLDKHDTFFGSIQRHVGMAT